MSDKRYEANIIRTTAVEPANNLETTSAPGVWSIDEVVELQKKNKWPTAGNVATDVTDVFSTFLYDGTSADLSINNGINLSGEGGLVWFKDRNYANNHRLYDTARGVRKYLDSSATAAEATNSGSGNSNGISAFNSNGFTIGNDGYINDSSSEYVSWTFRKAPKFFDVVTYTGNFTAGTTISHNLGQEPGMIIFKDASNTRNWYIYHRSLGKSTFLSLDQTIASFSNTFMLNNTDPTSTEFTLGEATNTNANGATYVAYLFAHNNNDGGFGPDQDQDIIKCGSYTGNGTTDGSNEITLGFEPQWIFLKRSDGSGYYSQIIDSMRGMVTSNNDQILWPNVADAENGTINSVDATATGFSVNDSSNSNLNGSTWIYMAIRRGPLAIPEDATKVFFVDSGTAANNVLSTGFNPDMSIVGRTTGGSKYVGARLTGSSAYLFTDSTAAEASYPGWTWDESNQFKQGMYNANNVSWTWKRAPSYFDVVAYSGTGSARTISHNLGAVPEMMWVKTRTGSTGRWAVYHKDLGNTGYLFLNDTDAAGTFDAWNNTTPTSSVFSLSSWSTVNDASRTYIAYLFATVAGVSKVGSYTADGNAQNIDCGFSSGAKFVLIKRSNGTGNWFVLDTARGIVAGNDPLLELNTNSAQDSGYDNIDPYNAGFTITAYGGTSPYLNISGATYIFYAIAT